MKRIMQSLILIVVIGILSISISATSYDTTYTYSDGDLLIKIDMTYINEVQANRIIKSFTVDSYSDSEQYNLLCTLFGHDLNSAFTSVVTHNYYSTAPHCKEDSYKVEACSRCDYVVKTLASTARKSCH